MASLSDAFTRAMVQSVFGRVAPAAPAVFEVAVVLAFPPGANVAGEGIVEPNDPAYERQPAPNEDYLWPYDPVEQAVVFNGELMYPQSTVEWGSVVGVALYDQANPQDYYGFIEVTPPRMMKAGDTLKIPHSTLQFNLKFSQVSVAIEEYTVPEILTAPNGNRYVLTINNSGVLVPRATPMYGPPTPPLSFAYNPSTFTFTWVENVSDGSGDPDDSFRTSYTLWWSADGQTEFEILPLDSLEYELLNDGVAPLVPGVYWLTADNQIGTSEPTIAITVAGA